MAAARASLPLVLPPPASRGLAPCWHCCVSAKPAACHPQSAWPPVAVRGNFLVGVGGGERPRSLGEGHTDGCVVGWDPRLQGRGPLLQRERNPRSSPPPSPQDSPSSDFPTTSHPVAQAETRASPSTPPPHPSSLVHVQKLPILPPCSSPPRIPSLSRNAAAAPPGWPSCLLLTSPSRGCQRVLLEAEAKSHCHPT